MIDFVKKYAKNIKYSQNGEEGILLEIHNRIGPFEYCCEYGAHNGRYCSNTRYFIDELKFKGVMIEADKHLYGQISGDGIEKINCEVNPSNINYLVSDYVDILSIDTDDNNDYDCFMALRHRPRVIVIEINSGIRPTDQHSKTGYRMMTQLGIDKGYFLLCHTGNLVFVDEAWRTHFPEIVGNGIDNYEQYFNESWLNG